MVQAGDTLWKIAQKYSTPNQLILAWGYRLPHSEKSYPFAKISTNDGKHGEEIRIPQEDDIILFTGEHYMQTPRDKRRVILVATMI